jgi:hypothetical protein
MHLKSLIGPRQEQAVSKTNRTTHTSQNNNSKPVVEMLVVGPLQHHAAFNRVGGECNVNEVVAGVRYVDTV